VKTQTTTVNAGLVVPDANLQTVTIEIQGETSLLTHAISPETLEILEGKAKARPDHKNAARDPDAEFRSSLYVIDADAGRYGFPAAGIQQALVCAGGRAGNAKMTELRAAIRVRGDKIEILNSAPRKRRDVGRNQKKGLVVIYRAEFPGVWKMKVPVTFNASKLSLAQVVSLFELAGFAQGIGAWRPENDGTFGQFTVTPGQTFEVRS
jgi:hypothetical protein